jgi:DNA modification methylase
MVVQNSPDIDLRMGDCVDGMRQIEAQSVDLIFADPPFNIGQPYGGDSHNDRRADYYEWCETWIDECFRILKSTGTIYLMTMSRHLGKLYPTLESRGVFISHINWRNVSAGQSQRAFWRSTLPILVYAKSKDYVFHPHAQVRRLETENLRWGSHSTQPRGPLLDYWDDIPRVYAGAIHHQEAILVQGTNQKLHPCQMPVDLPKRAILVSTNPGAIVVEPFAGVAGTAVACIETGRQYIGFEKEPVYVEAAQRRIAGAALCAGAMCAGVQSRFP